MGKKQNQKGMTLIELIIVVALIGIIGAVLVPTFSNVTNKARITTDISTVKTFQRQVDIFEAEFGYVPGIKAASGKLENLEVYMAIDELVDKNYMDTKYVALDENKNFTLTLKTADDGTKVSVVSYDPAGRMFKLTNVPEKYMKVIQKDVTSKVWILNDTN